MRRFKTHRLRSVAYYLIGWCMLAISACSEELSILASEGEEATIQIPYSVEGATNVVSSRAPSDNAVNDLYIIIFDASGAVKARRHFSYAELNNGTNGSQPGTTTANNWVSLTTTSGLSHIYGFANLNGTADLYTNNIKTDLDAITTRTALQNLSLTLKEDLTRVGNTYLMSGKLENYAISNAVVTTLPLRRVDSSLTFKLTTGGNCTSFTLQSYQVFNVPKKSRLVEQTATKSVGVAATWDGAQQSSDFFTSRITTGTLNTSEGFQFYMLENRKNGVKAITGLTEKAAYAQREKQLKTTTGLNEVTNGAYEYAPELGTYIVLRGYFTGTSTVPGHAGTVEASVQYTIHLGYAEGATFLEKANDFFSNRNTQYTYNISILGINDIIIEVVSDTETENAPGAEGDVIYTQGSTRLNLDAHYETVLLKFNKSTLQTGNLQSSDFFTYKVITPFTKMGATDESWIRIVRNDKVNGVYSTDLKPYPTTSYITLAQLVAELKANSVTASSGFYDNNNDVVYTCHLDEFYYDTAPTGTPALTGNLWRYFTNTYSREVHILTSVDLSPDKMSSITSSSYILVQRAIQTFFDVTSTETFSAYGVESVDETGPIVGWGKYPSQIGLYTITNDNTGQANFLKIVQQLKTKVASEQWSTYLNWANNGYKSTATTTVNAMLTAYNRAYLACMQRNRDLNGNGIIDDSEIKWYLPALNQYAGMFVGDAGLSEAAKLYTETTYIYKHFLTSSARSANSNLVVYWGEESVSTSCNTEYGMAKYLPGGTGADYLLNYYRCMRNLGTGEPISYLTTSGSDITTPYLNKRTFRSSVTFGEIGRHNNWNSESQLTSNGFTVYTTARVSSNVGAAMQFDLANSANSACYSIAPVGTWRAPNVRELYLMRAAGLLQSGDVSRTIFKFYNVNIPPTYGGSTSSGGRRIGWFFNGNNITMGSGATTEGSYIRCVRDR